MRRLAFVCTVVLVAVGLWSADPAVADYPPESASRGITVLDADSGHVRWTRKPSPGLTFQRGQTGNGIVVATEQVCTEYGDSGPAPVVRAFDVERRTERWSLPGYVFPQVDFGAAGVVVIVGGEYPSEVRGVALKSGATVWAADQASTGVVVGVSDTLVFATVGEPKSRVLRASSKRTGKVSFEFPRTPDPAWTDWFNVVAADSTTVVVANGGYSGRRGSEPLGPTTFFVLDSRTGAERARFSADDPQLRSSGVAMGRGVLAYSERGSIVARDLDDGSVTWQRSFSDEQPEIVASTKDLVVFSAQPDVEQRVGATVDAADRRIRALDLRSGATRWAVRDAMVRASDDRTIVAIGPFRSPSRSGADRRVRAIDLATGRLRWSRSLPASMPGDTWQHAFAVHGDAVVVTDACDLG